MARSGYLALAWSPAAAETAAAAETLARDLDAAPSWTPAAALPGLRLWTTRPHGLPVALLPDGAGVAVGELFVAPGRWPRAAGCAEAPLQFARRLAAAAWGRYVVLFAPRDGLPAAARDPGGQLDALTWRLRCGVQVIASEPSRLPPALQPPDLRLDWDRIWSFLAAPATRAAEPLFQGVAAVAPGEFARLDGTALQRTPVWRPADFALAPVDARDAGPELVARVDAAVARLVQGHARLLVEVSGGLDSAIVAAALAGSGQAGRVAQWLHRAGARPEADETAYARSVTDRLGVPLTVTPRRPAALAEAELMALAPRFWPAMAGIEAARDRDETERLVATGATAIVCGEGGDAALFQMPTPLVAADAIDADGLWRTLASLRLADLARRTRRSVWQVLAEARRARRAPPRWSGLASIYVGRDRGDPEALVHPWVADARARGVPPAKTLQVVGLSARHLFPGQSRRREAGDLLLPLLAQPVVELCLAIPAPDLAAGDHDRAWARTVFAERLPDAVRHRRAKGDLSVHYARMVDMSLPTLRPFLLDGCLAEAGVVDRARLDAALTPERLLWGEAPTQILWAAATEAWVRHWQGRVPDAASARRFRTLG